MTGIPWRLYAIFGLRRPNGRSLILGGDQSTLVTQRLPIIRAAKSALAGLRATRTSLGSAQGFLQAADDSPRSVSAEKNSILEEHLCPWRIAGAAAGILFHPI
jgi:hypothetical protein